MGNYVARLCWQVPSKSLSHPIKSLISKNVFESCFKYRKRFFGKLSIKDFRTRDLTSHFFRDPGYLTSRCVRKLTTFWFFNELEKDLAVLIVPIPVLYKIFPFQQFNFNAEILSCFPILMNRTTDLFQPF